MRKKFLALLLILAMALPFIPENVFAAEIIQSGECGENITWKLDSDGLLTISGSGEMQGSGNFAYQHYTIKTVKIGKGITAISPSAFLYCGSLKNVTIPDSMTTINARAFESCVGLEQIYIPNSVTFIGSRSFYYCVSLVSMVLPSSISSIESFTFSACYSLSSITIPASITYIGLAAFADCFALNDIYYTGTEEDWEKIIIEDNNDYLVNATIHFNSDYTDNLGSIRFFTSWDADNQIAYFDSNPIENPTNLGSQVTEETDTSFLERVNELVGTYVLVETKKRDDGMIAPNTLISITSVPMYTGTVTEIGNSTISIDGVSYPVAKSLYPLFFSVGDFVRYHLYDGEVVGIGEYNGENPDIPESVYELLLTPSEETMSIEVGQTLEIICRLYCDGVRVEEWEQPQASIFHSESPNPLVTVGWKALSDGSYKLTLSATAPGTASVTITELASGESKTVEVVVGENIFVKELYHADNLLEDDVVNLNDLIRYINQYSPSVPILYNGDLDDWSEAWDELTLFYDSFEKGDAYIKEKFKQTDVYETILLNALECSTTNDSTAAWVLEIADKAVDTSKDLLTITQNILKIKCNWTLDVNKNISDMTDKEKADLKNAFEEALKSSGYRSAVAALKKYADFLGEIMKIATTASDLVEKTTAYLELWYVSDSMANVLSNMLDKIPETEEFAPMREAVEFCISMINETNREQFEKCALLRANFMTGGKYAITEGVSYLWKGIRDLACKNNTVLSSMLIGYKSGKIIANWLFDADNLSEHVFKLRVTSRYISFLESAILKIRNEYQENRTPEDANTLLSAVSLLHSFAINECDIACSFSNAVDKATASKIAGAISGTNKDAKTILYEYATSTKENLIRQNVDAATHWVYHLEEDYPAHYSEYEKLIGDDRYENALIVPITSEYIIECPVNVRVYDKTGTLVLELSYDGAYGLGDVSGIQIGDKKIVNILNTAEYSISCDGYAEGKMDVSVREYQGATRTRDAVFYDLKVTEESVHKLDTRSDFTDNSIYTITTEDTVIPADMDTGIENCLVHQYGEPRFEWNSFDDCNAQFICVAKDDIQIIACTIFSETTPATETKDGQIIYIATAEFNNQTYTDIKIEVIPAEGHVTHTTTLVPAVDATCENPGNIAYYICFGCDDWFEDAYGAIVIDDKTSVVIAKLEHSFINYVSNNNATCIVDGTMTAKCDNGCGKTNTVTDTGSAKGHNYVAVVTKPTCTEHGYTTYTCHCGYSYVYTYVDEPINVSYGKDYTLSASPNTEYPDTDSVELTDGYYGDGDTLFSPTWVGFNGESFYDIVVDLGATVSNMTKFSVNALQLEIWGIQLPKEIVVYVSNDKTDWTEVGTMTPESDVLGAQDNEGGNTLEINLTRGVSGRYVKFSMSQNRGFIFIGEVSVYAKDDTNSALGHSFTNYVSDGNATTEADGTKTALCDRNCGAKDTVTDVGSKIEVSDITSDKYTVSGGFIQGISINTTVNGLVSSVNEREFVKVVDKNGNAVSGTTLLGTGMKVQLVSGGKVIKEVIVVVTGDTNGDGKITVTDMIAVKSHLLNKSALSGAAAKAGDANNDNGISITDFIRIKAHILGKSSVAGTTKSVGEPVASVVNAETVEPELQNTEQYIDFNTETMYYLNVEKFYLPEVKYSSGSYLNK